ncbi:NAD-dependent succinate-semialdehyde dehydrogenase [Mesorhizobium sp. WSM4887]|uniref:NAD-dependent succinate-semialdehyde dehydrogenase n=1 Tax=Mesorhizobium sp. WSM4887 TaxID=3038543 RepID=UPI00241791DA|nr:NAD-dependent succinate-semialdehyde dehydrogenase [Mesorhizobium sp. WSM4887]MDG4886837.1 NAD-dependent succinate-semialdehyde dehydrogenase [Mesorhizobium sp. WSM4887]
MNNYPDVQLYIDGKWRPAEGDRWISVTDPSNAQEIGRVAHATQRDLDAALVAADTGFGIWSRTSAFERAKIMRRAAENLRSQVEEIARWMTLEQGKPLAQSRLEALAGADIIDWFAGEAQRTYGQVIPARASDILQVTIKRPVGPVAAFTPWNFPINQIVRKLSAAVAAGCSIIIKAPVETPASPAGLIKAFDDAGIPPGVVNLINGRSTEISRYLIPHPIIRKISFTGSTAVGKELAALAGLHMKRSTMELGGHAPVIVADDADLDLALATMVPFKFRNAGQVCISPTRFLVAESVFDEFSDRFGRAAKEIKVGNGLHPTTEMGPLINEKRVETVDGLVTDALKRGARLVAGGRRIGNQGSYYEPTVLANVPSSALIMNEEPFGPVAVINSFSAVDEAIAEANRLPFGLAAYAYTRDGALATRLGNEIRSGMTSINHVGLALPEVPFGGVGDSGFGTEGGSEAIESYLDTSFVTRKG